MYGRETESDEGRRPVQVRLLAKMLFSFLYIFSFCFGFPLAFFPLVLTASL